jgi:hypothetical protein
VLITTTKIKSNNMKEAISMRAQQKFDFVTEVSYI